MAWHFLLQGIFPTQGSNPRLLHLQADSLSQSHPGSPLCGKCCAKTDISLYAHLQLRRKQASFIFKDVEIEAWRVFTAGATGGGWLCGASLSLLRMFFMWPEAGLPFPPSGPQGLVCPMPDFHYQHGSHLPSLWMCLRCTICLFWWSSGKQREKEGWHWRSFYESFLRVEPSASSLGHGAQRPCSSLQEATVCGSVREKQMNLLWRANSGLSDPICVHKPVESWREPVMSPL